MKSPSKLDPIPLIPLNVANLSPYVLFHDMQAINTTDSPKYILPQIYYNFRHISNVPFLSNKLTGMGKRDQRTLYINRLGHPLTRFPSDLWQLVEYKLLCFYGNAGVSEGPSTLIQTEISERPMDGLQFSTDIHGSHKSNPNHFGDPLTFQLTPSSGQHFNLANTLFSYQIFAKLVTFPSAVLCVLQKCQHCHLVHVSRLQSRRHFS